MPLLFHSAGVSVGLLAMYKKKSSVPEDSVYWLLIFTSSFPYMSIILNSVAVW